MKTDISVLDKGFVHLKDVYGSDLTVVNFARVSFGKQKSLFDESDAKLCNYLAEHEHTSPFRSCGLVFHVKMPIFVMRQFIRHRLGVEVNEISGRYVEFAEDEFYVPEKFRLQSTSNKQGSETSEPPEVFQKDYFTITQEELLNTYIDGCKQQMKTYRNMLSYGIAKEMARMCLPLSLYTEYMVFMSLQAVGHFCRLRFDGHAQKEIQQYALAFNQIALEQFPYSYSALMKGRP